MLAFQMRKQKETRTIQYGEAATVVDMLELQEARSKIKKGETNKWLLVVSCKRRCRKH